MGAKLHFFFLNIGHFFDHLLMLVFATVAALTLTQEWGMTYAELIPYATPGFIAFGIGAVPAGWLADRWSRTGMLSIFFFGLGLSAVLTALATDPVQIAIGLFAMGLFAAIYHPVGLSLVVEGRVKTGMPLAINGVFGNFGVGCAALLSGWLIDSAGWKSAFVWPGVLCCLAGVGYLFVVARYRGELSPGQGSSGAKASFDIPRSVFIRLLVLILFSTAIGGLIFQSTTFALPKILDERLGELAVSATLVGWYAFVVFAIAAIAQLVVGYFVDKHALRTVFIVVAGLQVALFAMMPGLVGWTALGVATAFMLAVFGQIPINDVLVGRIARAEWRSRMFALRYVVTFSVMATSVPLIAAIHAGRGFDTLFVVLAGAAAAILCAAIALPRTQTTMRLKQATSRA